MRFEFWENSVAHGLVRSGVELTHKETTLILESGLSNMNENEAPPLHPKVSLEDFEKMSPEEQSDYLFQLGKAAIARYAGRLDLFLKENPQLDFEHPPKKVNPAA